MQLEAARRLAVCVDDYGLDPAIDDAVLMLARQGRINATSCMTGAPHWQAGAPALRELQPHGFGAGLHLDLTAYPFDPDLRRPLRRWLVDSHLRTAPRAALRVEIHAQLEAFERCMGRPPAHVDGHQHVHQLPQVRDVLLDALEARYGASWPRLRSTRRPPGLRAGRKAWLIEALGSAGLARLASAKGYGQNGHLLGVYDFQGGADRYLALLEQWLAAAADGDQLMCHPATRLVHGDAIAPARVWEYEVLSGPAFAALLERQAIRVGISLAAETMRS